MRGTFLLHYTLGFSHIILWGSPTYYDHRYLSTHYDLKANRRGEEEKLCSWGCDVRCDLRGCAAEAYRDYVPHGYRAKRKCDPAYRRRVQKPDTRDPCALCMRGA